MIGHVAMYVGALHWYALRIDRVRYYGQSGVENRVKKASYGHENFTCQQKTVIIPNVDKVSSHRQEFIDL